MRHNIVRQIVEDSKKAAGSKDPAAKNPVALAKSDLDPKLAPVKGKTTLSGLPKTAVDPQPGIYDGRVFESVVATFARMNPPTVGHERLVREMSEAAAELGADVKVYLSHSSGNARNPLVYESKLELAKIAFGDVVVESAARDIISMVSELSERYSSVIVYCGEDRHAEISRVLKNYNGVRFNVEHIDVVALPRSGDLLEHTVSATDLRVSAAIGDLTAFSGGLPEPLREFSEEIMQEVRGDLQELTVMQRTKRAQALRRNKSRLKTGRARALARRASTATISKRARRLAIKHMRKRLLRGSRYEDLSYGQRQQVDNRLKRRKKSIAKLAKRLMPKVARAEASRQIGHGFKSADKRLGETIDSMLGVLIAESTANYQINAAERNALQQKADAYDIDYSIVESVFYRGLAEWSETSKKSQAQHCFERVNSFLNGGRAWQQDFDLVIEDCELKAARAKNEMGPIDHVVRGIIDAEKSSDVEIPHRHKRDSAVHRTDAVPGAFSRKEIIAKIIDEQNTSKEGE